MKEYQCVTCDTIFKMGKRPEYCPGCGKPRNESLGMEIAKSNPNLTGFVTPSL